MISFGLLFELSEASSGKCRETHCLDTVKVEQTHTHTHTEHCDLIKHGNCSSLRVYSFVNIYSPLKAQQNIQHSRC